MKVDKDTPRRGKNSKASIEKRAQERDQKAYKEWLEQDKQDERVTSEAIAKEAKALKEMKAMDSKKRKAAKLRWSELVVSSEDEYVEDSGNEEEARQLLETREEMAKKARWARDEKEKERARREARAQKLADEEEMERTCPTRYDRIKKRRFVL